MIICPSPPPGPYVYALYAAYGFSSSQIAQLFVAGCPPAGYGRLCYIVVFII